MGDCVGGVRVSDESCSWVARGVQRKVDSVYGVPMDERDRQKGKETSDLLTWCEVSEAAMRSNVQNLRRLLSPGARLGVVVKSDGYGHGAINSARIMIDSGVDWLIVNALEEAEELRAAGIEHPLYVCGHVPSDAASRLAELDVDVVVYDAEMLDALNQAAISRGTVLSVHIKVETGTHRQGVTPSEALQLGRHVQSLPGVRLGGLSTHYADIEDTTDHEFAFGQLRCFNAVVEAFEQEGMVVPLAHSANSAATILYPTTHLDMVRVGISAYGLWPSAETWATALQIHARDPSGFVPELEPCLSWRARLAAVKEVPAGVFVGYGRTYRSTHTMKLAVVPVGYYEGYDRRLSNLGHVLIGGVRAPVRGRVCMNMFMVDVTHIPGAKVGSVATLLGRDGSERITAEQLASWVGGINYETVSRIHSKIPRILA